MPPKQRSSHIDHPACPATVLILDCPASSSDAVNEYAPILEAHGATTLVRLCDPGQYDPAPLTEKCGIHVVDLPFEDGTPPPDNVLREFREVVRKLEEAKSDSEKPCIAIHCISGIGRAPVMAAVVLIDHGVDPLTAVEYIRARRRGAINTRQLNWVTSSKVSLNKKSKCNIL